MKIIETLNSGMKKIAKGMFALFTINLLIFGGMLLVQSCQTDDDNFEISKQNIELENFKRQLISTSAKVKVTLKKRNSDFLAKSNNTTNQENEAKEVLKPLVKGAKGLLLSYGFSEKEITDEFGGLENKEILMAGLAILEIEKEAEKNEGSSLSLIENNDLFFMFGQSLNAQTYKDFKRCALDASGIAGLGLLLKHGIKGAVEKLGKKAVLKKVGKVLARTLGWIGTAWAIGDFAHCMYNS